MVSNDAGPFVVFDMMLSTIFYCEVHRQGSRVDIVEWWRCRVANASLLLPLTYSSNSNCNAHALRPILINSIHRQFIDPDPTSIAADTH